MHGCSIFLYPLDNHLLFHQVPRSFLHINYHDPVCTVSVFSLEAWTSSTLPSFRALKIIPQNFSLSQISSSDLTIPGSSSPSLILPFFTSVPETSEVPISLLSLHWGPYSLLKQFSLISMPKALNPEVSCHSIQSLLHTGCYL